MVYLIYSLILLLTYFNFVFPGYARVSPFETSLPGAERQRLNEEQKRTLEDIVRKVINESVIAHNLSDEDKRDWSQRDRSQRVGKLSNDIRSVLSRQYEYPELVDKRVSLSLKDIDIRDAIELVGKSVGFSFLVDPDVKGTIKSLSFDDVPLAIVLRNLLHSNYPKLALLKDCGLFRITRLANAKDVLIERGDSDFVFDVVPLFFARWSESEKRKIEKMWRGIVGGDIYKPGYYLVVDPDSKKVFVRGKSYHVSLLKKFLKEIDWEVPQVKIEARFVCAEKGFEENIGFQWSGIYNRCSSVKKSGFHFCGMGRPLSDITNNPQVQSQESLVDWALNFLPTPSKIAKTVSFPFVFGGKDLSTRRLNLVLNAAEDRNEIKTILKPTILANDCESAEILVGENVPIETVVEESIEGRLRNIRTASYKDIGIQLKVRPVVSPDNKTVFLDVFIENSQQSDSVKSGDISYPVIRTTRSRTKVRLKSGQTTMISGLIKDVKSIDRRKIPLFGELPIIGWLFRGSRRVKRDMQLLIFITPTVI